MSKKVRTAVVQFVSPAAGKIQEIPIQRPQYGDNEGPAGWNTTGCSVFPVRGPEGADLVAIVSTYIRKEVSSEASESTDDEDDSED